MNPNTNQWEQTCGGEPGGPVDALLIVDTTLYVGGAILNGGGEPTADGMIKCDINAPGVTISANDGTDDLTGRVQTLARTDDGSVYVGRDADSRPPDRQARHGEAHRYAEPADQEPSQEGARQVRVRGQERHEGRLQVRRRRLQDVRVARATQGRARQAPSSPSPVSNTDGVRGKAATFAFRVVRRRQQ